MKKTLIIAVILIMGVMANTVLLAENNTRKNSTVQVVTKTNIFEKFATVRHKDPNIKKIVNKKNNIPLRHRPFGANNSFPVIANYQNTGVTAHSFLSVPAGIIGTFNCKGVSYFGGIVTGETIITADAEDQNKIWFENLVPGGSNKKVYGIIASDNKTVNIPQPQVIYTEGLYKVYLEMYNSTDPITGVFDEATGVLSISSDLWGSHADDGWYELFTGITTYTRTDMSAPEVSYSQPDGALFLGLVPDSWDGYYSACIVGSPFSTWTWRNENIEESVSYNWTYTDSVSGQSFSVDADSLIMDVDDSYYGTPKLKATNSKGISSTFILGTSNSNIGYDSYTIAGGSSSWLGFDPLCDHGVANQDNGFDLLSPGAGAYYFGTGASTFTDADYQSLMVQYDKPLSTLYFEGVNVYLYVFNAPDDAPFTLDVVLAEKDEDGKSKRGSVIATKTIKAKDVTSIEYDNQVVGYTMQFNGFKVMDDDGFVVDKEYIEIDQAFFLELKGIDQQGVTLAVCTESINPPGEDSRSCFSYVGNDTIYQWNNYRQTMYFNLDAAAYPYISLSEEMLYDNRSGGTYQVEVSPFFDTLYIGNESIPDWLQFEFVDEAYTDDVWGATLVVTIDPLAADAEARYFDLEIKSTASSRILTINQGGEVSASSVKTKNDLYAVQNKEGFLVVYPNDMRTLTVYSASGIVVGKYLLSDNGRFQLSDSGLGRGVYLLQLQNGKESRTVKISK